MLCPPHPGNAASRRFTSRALGGSPLPESRLSPATPSRGSQDSATPSFQPHLLITPLLRCHRAALPRLLKASAGPEAERVKQVEKWVGGKAEARPPPHPQDSASSYPVLSCISSQSTRPIRPLQSARASAFRGEGEESSLPAWRGPKGYPYTVISRKRESWPQTQHTDQSLNWIPGNSILHYHPPKSTLRR